MSASAKSTNSRAKAKVAEAKQDLDVILPPVEQIVVAGVECEVSRIRTRELMLLVRVLTSGFGANVDMLDLESDDWQQNMLGMLLMAVPEAHSETLDLLRVLVKPREPIADADQRKAFELEMANPDVETTMDVLTVMLQQEADLFPQLVGKGRTLVKVAQAMFRKGMGAKTTKTTG